MPEMAAQKLQYVAFWEKREHEMAYLSTVPPYTAWFSRIDSDDLERVTILRNAFLYLEYRKPVGRSVMKGEELYHALYWELKNNESQWFDDILSNVYNMNLCAPLLSTLGTMVSLYRNRGELELTGDIMKLKERIIVIFSNIVNTPGLVESFVTDPDRAPVQLREMIYSHNTAMLLFTGQLHTAASATGGLLNYKSISTYYFRQVIEHEIISFVEGSPREREVVIWNLDKNPLFLESLLRDMHKKMTNPLDRSKLKRPTLEDLNRYSEDDLFEVLKCKFSEMFEENHAFINKKLEKEAELRLCDAEGCSAKEAMRGCFSLCSKCRSVRYCGRECQKAHWKVHKSNCVTKKEKKWKIEK